ncbi:MAG: hypothetical protein ACRDQ0_22350 [Pseudonocardia sp.]
MPPPTSTNANTDASAGQTVEFAALLDRETIITMMADDIELTRRVMAGHTNNGESCPICAVPAPCYIRRCAEIAATRLFGDPDLLFVPPAVEQTGSQHLSLTETYAPLV